MLRLIALMFIISSTVVFSDSSRTAIEKRCFEKYTKSQGAFALRGLQYSVTPGLESKVQRCVDEIQVNVLERDVYEPFDETENDSMFRRRLGERSIRPNDSKVTQRDKLTRESTYFSIEQKESSQPQEILDGYFLIDSDS